MSHVSTQQERVSTPITDESNWKQEFEELDRRFQGMPTEAEAKENARTDLKKHDGIVNAIETELAQAQTALTSASAAFLAPTDKRDIQKKIESLDFQLEQAKRLRERSIRINGGRIKDAKEWAPERQRWLELTKRAHDIDRAKNIAGGRVDQDIPVSYPKRW